jgi:hypothetical protein
VQQVRRNSQCLDGVLNSFRDKCLDIIKLFDMFSIKHIPREENSRVNRLAHQAWGYIVSQGVFWVASVSLVEHRYALRSKGKPILAAPLSKTHSLKQILISQQVVPYQTHGGTVCPGWSTPKN